MTHVSLFSFAWSSNCGTKPIVPSGSDMPGGNFGVCIGCYHCSIVCVCQASHLRLLELSEIYSQYSDRLRTLISATFAPPFYSSYFMYKCQPCRYFSRTGRGMTEAFFVVLFLSPRARSYQRPISHPEIPRCSIYSCRMLHLWQTMQGNLFDGLVPASKFKPVVWVCFGSLWSSWFLKVGIVAVGLLASKLLFDTCVCLVGYHDYFRRHPGFQ